MPFTFQGSRLTGFYIGITVDPLTTVTLGNYPQCGGQYLEPAYDGQIMDIDCDPDMEGRYVYIQLPGLEYLTLCEVEVYEVGKLNHIYASLL